MLEKFIKMKDKRIVRYFIMACGIVVLELACFQLIFSGSANYVLATIISFAFGVILNWILGRKLVFGASAHHPLKEFLMVGGASTGGVLIQLTVVFTVVEVLHLYPLIGKVASIAFSFFWNYWFRAQFIFKKQVNI